jgi:ribonucleotide monophosphatase NagD (HAD superfamily)
MTSGEVTQQYLSKRPTQEWSSLGKACLHFTWGTRGAVDVSALGLQVVCSPADCEFILAHGTEGLGTETGDVLPKAAHELQELMQECAELGGRPMVVANPDFVTVSGCASSPFNCARNRCSLFDDFAQEAHCCDQFLLVLHPTGPAPHPTSAAHIICSCAISATSLALRRDKLVPMPGSLGRFYAELGGEVRVMGKPSTVIYHMALDEMQLDPQDVVAVGDSIEHDIAGAGAMGIDSIFVAGGIHADHFRKGGEVIAEDESILRLQQEGLFMGITTPTYAMDFLRW